MKYAPATRKVINIFFLLNRKRGKANLGKPLYSGCFRLFASNHDNCDSLNNYKWRIRANDVRMHDSFVFHANIGLTTSIRLFEL